MKVCVCHGYQFCSDILLSTATWATEGTSLVSCGVLHTSRFQGIIRHPLFLGVLFVYFGFCVVVIVVLAWFVLYVLNLIIMKET